MCAITEIQDVRVYTGLFVKLCVKNDVCKILKKNHFFLDQPKIDFAPGWSQVLGLVVLSYIVVLDLFVSCACIVQCTLCDLLGLLLRSKTKSGPYTRQHLADPVVYPNSWVPIQ